MAYINRKKRRLGREAVIRLPILRGAARVSPEARARQLEALAPTQFRAVDEDAYRDLGPLARKPLSVKVPETVLERLTIAFPPDENGRNRDQGAWLRAAIIQAVEKEFGGLTGDRGGQ